MNLLPRQVVCTVKGIKGKPCHGGLKRYYPFADYYNEPDPQLREGIKLEFGADPKLILLKCENCRSVYHLPKELERKLQ
mgnify:CR=1 FL=1